MSPSDPPAIFFHADAIETKGKDLVGRRSAGQSFLRGFLQHMQGDQVRAVVTTPKAGQDFDAVARDLGETRPIHVRALRGAQDFTEFGTVFFPAPGFMSAAWRRQRFGPQRCSLVGITHTVSTRRVIEGLHNLLLEPVEPWDAIICTSRAVQSVVKRQMELEVAYIRQRFGATRVPVPQLPLIPLGIHADDFSQTDADRQTMRQRFDAPQDAVVVMTMGRLTTVEKANPAPMLIALEEVAQQTGKPVHLWMVGWASRDNEKDLHEQAAKVLAPSVITQIIDGRDADVRRHIWAGADIFTLAVDNIQETFGLVPVEAMAAGLPVIMPDWNGFRDTIVNGETGHLIPTRMTGPGHDAGEKIAARYADGTDDYLRYLSLIQQQTQIDMRAYVAALTHLATDTDARQRMGAAGQAHVRANLDWQAVIPQYAALADELAGQRNAQPTTPRLPVGPINPLEVDPFDLYQHYPTENTAPDMIVTHRKPLTLDGLAALDAVNGRDLYRRRIVPNAKVVTIAETIQTQTAMTLADLAQASGLGFDNTSAIALFLAKYDFVTLTPQGPK